MNSERIQQQFGSVGLDVIESSAQRRISSLYSLDAGRKVCRTYAQVEFSDYVHPSLAAEHALVLSGQSIGTVFKSRGWDITKRHTRLGSRRLTAIDREIARAMHLDVPRQVAVHSYVFEVTKNGRAYDYAAITEMHHPRYLTEADLQSIYGRPAKGDPESDPGTAASR